MATVVNPQHLHCLSSLQISPLPSSTHPSIHLFTLNKYLLNVYFGIVLGSKGITVKKNQLFYRTKHVLIFKNTESQIEQCNSYAKGRDKCH